MPSKKDKLVDLQGELIPPYDTEKAYHFHDGKTTVWLPKSHCEWDETDKTMTMPYWLAEQKELI